MHLVDRQAEQRRGHVHGEQQRGERRGAGIAVGGDRDRHAVPAEQLDRRLLRLAQEIEGAGQQHRHGAGLGHRGGAGLVGVFQVVGGERAEARGERRAAEVGELVGVQLHRQAEPLAPPRTRAPSAPALKAMPSHEGVDGVGQPLARRSPAASRRRRARCRRPCRRRPRAAGRARRGRSSTTATGRTLAETAGGAQLARLRLGIEAVARLDLDRGDALGDQRVEPRQRWPRPARPRSPRASPCTVERMPPPARAISS